MESFSEKIRKDVEELADKSIFKSMYFCSFSRCHAYKRHYKISRNTLLKRVKNMHGISVSRFFSSLTEDQIAGLVYEALSHNCKQLERGLSNKKDINDTFVIVHDFKRPIGEGCFNETGVRFFTMSRLCIVINRKPFNGKTFFIASFYPESNMDEIDIVNDVIDGFL